MTHDEWIENLSKYINIAEQHAPATAKIVSALRAVVEYHQPYESKNYGLLCRGCDEDPNYPCGTIRAIEKELG
jgi:hypothetical protein